MHMWWLLMGCGLLWSQCGFHFALLAPNIGENIIQLGYCFCSVCVRPPGCYRLWCSFFQRNPVISGSIGNLAVGSGTLYFLKQPFVVARCGNLGIHLDTSSKPWFADNSINKKSWGHGNHWRNGITIFDNIVSRCRPSLLCVSQHMLNNIRTNLWKFELNRSSKLRYNDERKKNLGTQRCVLSDAWFRDGL